MLDNQKIGFQIRGIVVSKFNIDLKDEFAKVYESGGGKFSEYTFEVKCTNKGYVPDDLMEIEVLISIFLDKEKQTELGHIQVHNLYEVKNLKQFHNEKENILYLPYEFETTLVSISLSHSRAIMITKCAGTFLQNAILPVLNPSGFVRPRETKPSENPETSIEKEKELIKE